MEEMDRIYNGLSAAVGSREPHPVRPLGSPLMAGASPAIHSLAL